MNPDFRVARSSPGMAVLAIAIIASGCAGQQRPPASPSAPAPTADEAANITYRGIEEAGGPVSLRGGSWEGAPYVEGSATRPAVSLVPGPIATGDLDGDGKPEAVVLLASSGGGSGLFSNIAIIGRRTGRVENLATRALGDRVQLRSMAIDDGRLSIDVVRAGPDDPACCPGELATYTWVLDAGGLSDGRPPVVTGRLSAAMLDGSHWVLRRLADDDPAPDTPVITLEFAAGQLRGQASCNAYFAGIADAASAGAGAIQLGPVGTTRMMCPDAAMALEGRYLDQLGRASRFGFMNGRLMLEYPDGVMLFDDAGAAAAR